MKGPLCVTGKKKISQIRLLTISTAKLLWWVQCIVVVLPPEPVMWQPSALQPPCPSSRSKSQYAAVGSTPSAKCLRAIVTECTTLPRLQPSATKKPEIFKQ